MKNMLRKIFAPLLNIFERGEDEFEIKPLSRKILFVISFLFSLLATVVFYLKPTDSEAGYYLPVVIFGLIAFVGFIVALLGNDRAVAKIWGTRS